jgi:hypothetical protein
MQSVVINANVVDAQQQTVVHKAKPLKQLRQRSQGPTACQALKTRSAHTKHTHKTHTPVHLCATVP